MHVPVTILPNARLEQLDLFQIAPEVQVAARPRTLPVPRHGMMRWEPRGDGTYVPLIETHPAVVNLKRWKESLYGCDKEIIMNLVEAGFVEGERVAPRTVMINLESYFEFRSRMRANPWFWQDPDHRERYQKACATRHGRSRRDERASKTASDAPEAETAPLPLAPVSDASTGAASVGETKRVRKLDRKTA